MSKEQIIRRFRNFICGHYSNKSQAQLFPKRYAHINIYMRAIPPGLVGDFSIYSEQSYAHSPWDPYRQSIYKIAYIEDIFILKNYKLLNQIRIAGAGFNTKLINQINEKYIILREGCAMHFKEINLNHYIGEVEPGSKCFIEKEGKMTYLKSHVEITKHEWVSEDSGYLVNNKTKVWGSAYGPLRFQRLKEL